MAACHKNSRSRRHGRDDCGSLTTLALPLANSYQRHDTAHLELSLQGMSLQAMSSIAASLIAAALVIQTLEQVLAVTGLLEGRALLL